MSKSKRHSHPSFVPTFRSLPPPVNWVFRPQSARQADWWKKLAGKYLPPFATGGRLQRRGWRRWMSGSSCWCTPTNTLPLIIFIIYMPGAVWCTVTDYHNNDGARWMATRRKACFIIGMKPPACTRSLQKRRRAFMLDLAKLQTQHDQQCQHICAVTSILKSKSEHLRALFFCAQLIYDKLQQNCKAIL